MDSLLAEKVIVRKDSTLHAYQCGCRILNCEPVERKRFDRRLRDRTKKRVLEDLACATGNPVAYPGVTGA